MPIEVLKDTVIREKGNAVYDVFAIDRREVISEIQDETVEQGQVSERLLAFAGVRTETDLRRYSFKNEEGRLFRYIPHTTVEGVIKGKLVYDKNIRRVHTLSSGEDIKIPFYELRIKIARKRAGRIVRSMLSEYQPS